MASYRNPAMLWFDGASPPGRCPSTLADRGLTLGDGVFDTALARYGKSCSRPRTWRGSRPPTARLGFPVPLERIATAMRALAGEGLPLAAIRTTVTRGSGPRGLIPPAEPRPVLWASSAPLAPSLPFAPLTLHPPRSAATRPRRPPA